MNNSDERFQSIRSGLLEFVVLKVIEERPAYAADILQTLTETEFKTQEGTLYPLLSKLRRDELLDYEWRESDAGPPRKYYSLTDKGKKQLKDMKEYWHRINTTITSLGK